MTARLPRSTASDQGVRPEAVLNFLDAVEADPTVEMHSMILLRHGHVVAEGWWAPYASEHSRLVYSLSKSFTATALGLAEADGLLRLDDTLVSHFPAVDDDRVDSRSKEILLRHLAAMASGHDREMITDAWEDDPQEPVSGLLHSRPADVPGSTFAYNQPCTYSIAATIQRRSGMTLSDYLRSRLFEPLGIGEVGWWRWPSDREVGYTGLFIRTEDIAKLGQLYLQGGRWEELQILPAEFVLEATSRQVDTSSADGIDWQQGYGFQFWMARHGYRGDGALGQFCLVLPQCDAVIALTSATASMQSVLDHVWTCLLPGFGDGARRSDGQAELERRLRALKLRRFRSAGDQEDVEGWCSEPFAMTQPASAPFASVQLIRREQAITLALAEVGNKIEFAVGLADWETSEPLDDRGECVPVAAFGGWIDSQEMRIEVVFLETPHRLDITLHLPTRSGSATWRHEPLDGGSLDTLHRPSSPEAAHRAGAALSRNILRKRS